jgi:HPt (histidine-containing phosphotransfer) domain-containing protein
MTAAFDQEELMDRLDGDIEFLEESIEMLDEDLPPLLEQIQAAIAALDANSLMTSAHTLKGMLSNFCADVAERAAYDIEMCGRENRMDNVDTLAKTLSVETERLKADLRAFLVVSKG